jgi:crotonobetainyl-CoA:carnitine CoA-transferase CaiB-like acyl-CoA transferase
MQTIQHPKAGPYKMPAWPVRFSGSPPEVRPAPLLGGNNEDVLRDWLGMDRDAVGSLQSDKVM